MEPEQVCGDRGAEIGRRVDEDCDIGFVGWEGGGRAQDGCGGWDYTMEKGSVFGELGLEWNPRKWFPDVEGRHPSSLELGLV